jgi:hypothetical protein
MIRLILVLVLLSVTLEIVKNTHEGYYDEQTVPECPTECDEMFGACPYTGQVCVRGRCVKNFELPK